MNQESIPATEPRYHTKDAKLWTPKDVERDAEKLGLCCVVRRHEHVPGVVFAFATKGPHRAVRSWSCTGTDQAVAFLAGVEMEQATKGVLCETCGKKPATERAWGLYQCRDCWDDHAESMELEGREIK